MEAQEDDEEKIIEERRRKRAEILAKFKKQQEEEGRAVCLCRGWETAPFISNKWCRFDESGLQFKPP